MDEVVVRAIAVLNETLARDPETITRLVHMRVKCSAVLAAHPLIQTGICGGVQRVGVLGLLNAVLGDSLSDVIGARGSTDPVSGQFQRVKEVVDVRAEGVDVLTRWRHVASTGPSQGGESLVLRRRFRHSRASQIPE